jgi:hypothetical protein
MVARTVLVAIAKRMMSFLRRYIVLVRKGGV